MKNNKVVTATLKGISVQYTDTKKHFFIEYEEMLPIERKTSFKNYQDDVIKLNPKQVKMYRLALYGVEALTEKEYCKLSALDKINIKYNQKITQKLINRWKQQLVNFKINNLLLNLFPKSKLVKEMSKDNNYYCDELINTLSFKDLNITHKLLINKMIDLKCLPLSFYTVK